MVQAGPGGGAYVALPADAAQTFATTARFPVQATFNGVAYRGSTMPAGDGTFVLGVTKAVRSQAGAAIGATVHVVVERDTAERTVDTPSELLAALRAADLLDRFEAMPYSHRKEYAQWIAEARKDETHAGGWPRPST